MEILSSPVFTGGAGVVIAALMAGLFNRAQNRRSEKEQKKKESAVEAARADERVEAREREQREWVRHQASLREEREATQDLIERQHDEQREQLALQQAAKAQAEVRARTVPHLDSILDSLRTLEEFLEGVSSRKARLEDSDAKKVRAILDRVSVDVGYCGPEVREYIGVLLDYELAFKEYGNPDRLKRSEQSVLVSLSIAARELVYADLREESELIPDSYLEWIQSYVNAFKEWEEYEAMRQIEEAERDGRI